MEKYNLKQYILLLSTASMLNSACGFKSHQLGMMEPGKVGVSSGTTSTLGAEQALEQDIQYVSLSIHSLTNNSEEFKKLLKHEKDQFGKSVVQITAECRSQEDENSGFSNDVFLPIKEQAKKVFEEYFIKIKEILQSNYGWPLERIDAEWKRFPLVIRGSSQGGLVLFELVKQYGGMLNIIHEQYINTPAMGLDCFKLPLSKIQNLKGALDSISGFCPALVMDLYALVDNAVQKGLGDVSLEKLLNSHKDNPDMHRAFKEKLGKEYIDLVDNLKNYRGVIDMHPCAKEMWSHIRADESGNASETNNKGNNRTISLVCSDMGNDLLNTSIGMLNGWLPGASNILKASHGLSENDQFEGSDGVLPLSSQMLQRQDSFKQKKILARVENIPDQTCQEFSPEEAKILGYQSNVRPIVAKRYTHSGLCNIVSSLVPFQYRFCIPMLVPSSVLEDPNCYEQLMKPVYDLGYTPTTNTASTTNPAKASTSTLQDNDALD